MQLKFDLEDGVREKIFLAIQSERINRYKAATKGTDVSPLRLVAMP